MFFFLRAWMFSLCHWHIVTHHYSQGTQAECDLWNSQKQLSAAQTWQFKSDTFYVCQFDSITYFRRLVCEYEYSSQIPNTLIVYSFKGFYGQTQNRVHVVFLMNCSSNVLNMRLYLFLAQNFVLCHTFYFYIWQMMNLRTYFRECYVRRLVYFWLNVYWSTFTPFKSVSHFKQVQMIMPRSSL